MNQMPAPIAKGEVRNPDGRQNTPGRKAVNKLQRALDSAINLLGNTEQDGVTVLAGRIKECLDTDPIGTIKALSPLFPKDVHIALIPHNNLSQLSDSDIADEIATRARARLEDARDITDQASISVVEEPHLNKGHS